MITLYENLIKFVYFNCILSLKLSKYVPKYQEVCQTCELIQYICFMFVKHMEVYHWYITISAISSVISVALNKWTPCCTFML